MQQSIYHNPAYPAGILAPSTLSAEASQYASNDHFSPPVSTAIYGTTTTSSWAHTVPAFMPWVPEVNATAQVDPVVRFTAPFPPDPCTSQTATSWELLNNLGASKTNANLHLKRHSDIEEPEILPHKQYISEEKMAARMQQLHISNNYTIPHESSPFGPYAGEAIQDQKPVKSLHELEAMISPNSSEKSGNCFKGSIVLAPEIKSLVEPEKLFAKTLVHEIERPTMAVVLWKPPQGSIKDIISSSKDSKAETEKNDSQNNTLSHPFLVESNNNPMSFTDLIKNHSVSSLPPTFSMKDTDEDYEMEA